MNLVKKLAVGAATIAVALSSVTPAFAGNATNTNISGGSIAKAKSVEVTKQKVRVKNENTLVVNADTAIANTGLNSQSLNKDGNTLGTGPAAASSVSSTTVNYTSVTF